MKELPIRNEYDVNYRIRIKGKITILIFKNGSNPMILKKTYLRHRPIKNIF